MNNFLKYQILHPLRLANNLSLFAGVCLAYITINTIDRIAKTLYLCIVVFS